MKLAYAPAIACLAIVFSSTSAIAAPTGLCPLKLETKLVPPEKFRELQTHDHNAYLEIECTITNISQQPIFIEDDVDCTKWTTDNPAIRPAPLRSYARIHGVATTLAPGETFSKIVPVTFGGLKTGNKIMFNLQFHSMNGGIPPSSDTWRQTRSPYWGMPPRTSDRSPEKSTAPDLIASCPVTTYVPK